MSLSNEVPPTGENLDLDTFLKQLERIPWFAHVGTPVRSSKAMQGMSSWEDWPGPEDSSATELSHWQQSLHDELLGASYENRDVLTQLWNTIQTTVLTSADKKVPYNPNEDAWYAPNAAVWHAAWAAALVGLCLFLGRPIPKELQEQWNWFVQGHWPYAWLGDSPERTLLVY